MGPAGAGDPLYPLRTDLPADELRRNIRAVGQTLRGGKDWRWLRPAGAGADSG